MIWKSVDAWIVVEQLADPYHLVRAGPCKISLKGVGMLAEYSACSLGRRTIGAQTLCDVLPVVTSRS